MVYLRKIEARGFKSLGAKLVSTPIEKGFVAITGPNGSGKSNLLDAILFALGENSAKTLRVPNLSALIYDGSVEEQKPSSAKVNLQFDNSDRRIPIDSDSVTISRELKQNGESIYLLNGKHTQRNNLSDLLENALITSRGLNVVLQGMIMRIADLVPDEKRKLIEQMVGIAQFDEKKNLALQQLRDADVKLEVAMAKIGEIRDRVQSLEQQRNDMLRSKQLEGEINWLRAAAASTKLATVRRILAQRRETLADSSARFQAVQARLAELLKSSEGAETERNQLIKSAVDSRTAQIEAELGRASNELNALKRERQESIDYIEHMREVTPALSDIIEGNRRKISETQELINSIQEKIKQSEERKTQASAGQAELNEKRRSFESEFSAAQAEIGRFRKEKEEADSKLEAMRMECNGLKSEVRSSEDKLAATRDKIKFYAEGSADAQKSIDEIDSILRTQSHELDEIRKSKEKVEELRKKVEKQLDIAALIFEKTQAAVTRYDSDLSAIENVASEEIALTRLEDLAETNAIEGYIGPLRSIVSYAPEYSQAVAAVGRDWLNAIVVEDVKSLARTAEAAKKLRISRLTTIPLSEVSDFDGARSKKPSSRSIEGVIAPVSQVMHCERRYRRIVNFVFGDALIVDSPRNAFIAARMGFRSVTLQGDIFEPEIFAFETGYSKRYAKIADLLSKQEGFDGIRKILDSFRSLIQKRKDSLAALEAKAEGYDTDEQARNVDISKVETKLDASKQYLSRYADLSEQLKTKEKQIEQELASLQTLIAEKEKALNDQTLLCEKLSADLSAKDLSAFSERLTELNRKETEINIAIQGIAAEIRDLTTELTRARGELENTHKPTLERNLQQQAEIQKNVEAKTKFLTDTQGKLTELESAFNALKEEEEKILEKTSRFQPMLDALDQKLKTLKSEEETLRKSSTAVDREVVTANLDIGRMQDSERQLLGELAIYGYAEPIEAFDGAEALLKALSAEYEILRTNVNLVADRNYREIFENYKYSSVRKNELEKERNAIVTFIETIDSEKRRVFMEAFERIDKELRLIFNKMTEGSGWLEIENPDAIFDSGIFLMTQFPGKLPRDSSSVSGGEKTISALSFILAIQAVFPSPFYVFDEVDAHLDSKYSGKLAEILSERSDRSQIIIVSLKDNVVAKAGSVIGVYMSQGASKFIRYRSPMEVTIPNEQQQQQ